MKRNEAEAFDIVFGSKPIKQQKLRALIFSVGRTYEPPKQDKPIYPTEALLAARAVFFNQKNIQKGDTWQELPIFVLEEKLHEEIHEWQASDDPRELLDMINVAAMIYVRKQKDVSNDGFIRCL